MRWEARRGRWKSVRFRDGVRVRGFGVGRSSSSLSGWLLAGWLARRMASSDSESERGQALPPSPFPRPPLPHSLLLPAHSLSPSRPPTRWTPTAIPTTARTLSRSPFPSSTPSPPPPTCILSTPSRDTPSWSQARGPARPPSSVSSSTPPPSHTPPPKTSSTTSQSSSRAPRAIRPMCAPSLSMSSRSRRRRSREGRLRLRSWIRRRSTRGTRWARRGRYRIY